MMQYGGMKSLPRNTYDEYYKRTANVDNLKIPADKEIGYGDDKHQQIEQSEIDICIGEGLSKKLL